MKEPDAPRTSAQAKHCEDLCTKMEWRAACEAVLHMAYWSEGMESRARRNGRMACKLRRKLAAGKLELDSLRREVAALIVELAPIGCPPDNCDCMKDENGSCLCAECWAAWAKQAAQAGKDGGDGR